MIRAGVRGRRPLLLAQGNDEQARALLVELEQVAGIHADPYYAAALLPELVRTALALGAARARRAARGRRRAAHAARRARARAPAAPSSPRPPDEHAEAAALYAEAAERWREFGNVPERAYALLGQGRCLARPRQSRSRGAAAQARELFASMGFAPAVAEVDGLLGSPEAAAL